MKQNRLVSRLPFLFLIAKVHGITRVRQRSGSLCRLPAPMMHSGLRQGSTRASRPKQT